MLSVVAAVRRDSSSSNRVFETKIDVNRFEIRPKKSVTANPWIGPLPKLNRKATEMSAAKCVSTRVQKTRLKPL